VIGAGNGDRYPLRGGELHERRHLAVAWPELAQLTRSGERITPNEGLLVGADLMAGMLVLSIPAGRAARRLTDEELRQLRVGDALQTLLGRYRAFAAIALVLVTMAALLVGEIAVAAAS
jgi:hypothetical protein